QDCQEAERPGSIHFSPSSWKWDFGYELKLECDFEIGPRPSSTPFFAHSQQCEHRDDCGESEQDQAGGIAAAEAFEAAHQRRKEKAAESAGRADHASRDPDLVTETLRH